mgnify:CR=1 FL=1
MINHRIPQKVRETGRFVRIVDTKEKGSAVPVTVPGVGAACEKRILIYTLIFSIVIHEIR